MRLGAFFKIAIKLALLSLQMLCQLVLEEFPEVDKLLKLLGLILLLKIPNDP